MLLQEAADHADEDSELLSEIVQDLQDLARQEKILYKEIKAISAASKAAAKSQVSIGLKIEWRNIWRGSCGTYTLADHYHNCNGRNETQAEDSLLTTT